MALHASVTPICGDLAMTEICLSKVKRLLLPYLPPRDQQIIARGGVATSEVLAQYISLEGEPIDGGAIFINNVRFSPLVDTVEEPRAVVAAIVAAVEAAGAAFLKVGQGAADVSEAHSVIQAADQKAAAVMLASMASSQQRNIKVIFEGRSETISVPDFLTGLQLKSIAIASMGLGGGFQDYFLTLCGMPFGARSRVSEHPRLATTIITEIPEALLELVGDKPKAVGHT